MPNVTHVSQVALVDATYIAISRQFLNKTAKNLDENPYACLQFLDPVTFDAYQALVRYDHSETSGVLFDAMAARIQVIASHTGMSGIFRLIGSDVCEVLSIERVEGFLLPCDAQSGERPTPGAYGLGPMSELKALQIISDRLNRATDLEGLLSTALGSLDELLGLHHAMLLLPDETGERFVTLGSCGYGQSGIGAEVLLGEGLIGTAAKHRKPLRVTELGGELRYGRAIRERVREQGGAGLLRPEIPLPGLADADCQLAVPMLLGDELVGMLALESPDGRALESWHESFLQVLANQIALAIDRLRGQDDEPPSASRAPTPASVSAVAHEKQLEFVFFKNDDCVFVDGEYLVRNVPGKILWKILTEHQRGQRTQFTNRELRLDPTLGLPPIKDNLESRLILLRKRLVEKCPEVQLIPTQRGRFALSLQCPISLVEKAHG